MKHLYPVFLTLFCLLSLSACQAPPDKTAASPFLPLTDASFDSNADELKKFSSMFSALTDQEYDSVLAELIFAAPDPKLLQERLSACGIVVGYIGNRCQSSPNSYEATDIELVISSTRHTAEGPWRLSGALRFLNREAHPGDADTLLLYFDTEKARYVSYSQNSDLISFSSETSSDNLISFSLDDSKIIPNQCYICTVLVEPTGLPGRLIFGADVSHTTTNGDSETSFDWADTGFFIVS